MDKAKKKPTCFVISPIGADDSEVRKNANDFLELLVQPALDKFDFDVIRADKISRPTVITADIIRLVQEAELCVVDVSGSNPNVFYECGRRHESGKPFIQLVSKAASAQLPFDVAGIRTITYDLSGPRQVLESQRVLKEFVQQILDSGFAAATSGESLTSIARGIERLDRKLTRLVEITTAKPAGDAASRQFDSIEMALKRPQEVFRDALGQGNIDLALQCLPRIRQAAGYDEYIGALGVVTSIGDERAFALLESEIDTIVDGQIDTKHELLQPVVIVLKNYFGNTGKGKQGIEYLRQLFERLIAKRTYSAETRAMVANQIGMLAWLADDYEACLKYTQIASDLSPTEPAYPYNIALVHKATSATAELEATLRKLAAFSNLEGPHCKLLKEHGFDVKG